MYDKHPVYDVPQRNLVQRFFAQRWSAIALEIVLTVVIAVAASSAFEFFDPFGGEVAITPSAANESRADAFDIALEPVTSRALAHIQNREFAAAEAMYDLAVAVAPADADYYGWRGYINLRAGDYPDAQRDFRQVLELAPAEYEAHTALCWAYGESAEFDRALAHCNEAMALAQSLPEYGIALENRCWIQVEMGELEAAARDCLDRGIPRLQARSLRPGALQPRSHHAGARERGAGSAAIQSGLRHRIGLSGHVFGDCGSLRYTWLRSGFTSKL